MESVRRIEKVLKRLWKAVEKSKGGRSGGQASAQRWSRCGRQEAGRLEGVWVCPEKAGRELCGPLYRQNAGP